MTPQRGLTRLPQCLARWVGGVTGLPSGRMEVGYACRPRPVTSPVCEVSPFGKKRGLVPVSCGLVLTTPRNRHVTIEHFAVTEHTSPNSVTIGGPDRTFSGPPSCGSESTPRGI